MAFFLISSIRSSPPELFLGKGVLKICSKFTGQHPCRSAISIKLQSNLFLRTPLEGCSYSIVFRSSRSTANLLTVVSDRISRAFNRLGATWAVTLNISKAFDRVWHLHRLKSYGIAGQILGLILSFLNNRWLRVVLDRKSLQEYRVNAGVPQGSILGTTFFLLYINDLPDNAICNIAIYTDDTTLYSKCDQASGLWQQLELASELEFDLRNTMDWGRNCLVDFNTWKTQLVSVDRCYKTGAIYVKMDGSVLEEKTTIFVLLF